MKMEQACDNRQSHPFTKPSKCFHVSGGGSDIRVILVYIMPSRKSQSSGGDEPCRRNYQTTKSWDARQGSGNRGMSRWPVSREQQARMLSRNVKYTSRVLLISPPCPWQTSVNDEDSFPSWTQNETSGFFSRQHFRQSLPIEVGQQNLCPFLNK